MRACPRLPTMTALKCNCDGKGHKAIHLSKAEMRLKSWLSIHGDMMITEFLLQEVESVRSL